MREHGPLCRCSAVLNTAAKGPRVDVAWVDEATAFRDVVADTAPRHNHPRTRPCRPGCPLYVQEA